MVYAVDAMSGLLAKHGKRRVFVVPSHDKLFQVIGLGQVWQLPWTWLEDELEVIVIGYSVRPDGYHSRALLPAARARGARRSNGGEGG